MSALRQIRLHCLECCGTSNEVKLCQVADCKLYDYRLGKSPNRQKRELTEEQRKEIAERFKKSRESKS